MPRRLPVKPDRFIGNLFIILVFFTLVIVYYAVIVIVLAPRFLDSIIWAIMTGVIHFFLMMLVWWLVQTILQDPGQVPTFWGFHFGDHESKRKRYWLMCNVFKPERCHHCSTCNRWVLNMDHHWPWVNNCIGFWNRKPFILLLWYVLISSYASALTLTCDLYYRLFVEYENYSTGNTTYPNTIQLVIVILAEVVTCAASFIMTNFLKFHIELILENKTTLEFLEKKGEKFESIYNISPMYNWRQVFGFNQLLWIFPVNCASGHPWGDGIYWQINQEIRARVMAQNPGNHSVIQDTPGHNANSENQKFIENENRSDGPLSDNKENMNNQPVGGLSRRYQDSKDSLDSHIKFNPNIGQQFAKNIGKLLCQ